MRQDNPENQELLLLIVSFHHRVCLWGSPSEDAGFCLWWALSRHSNGLLGNQLMMSEGTAAGTVLKSTISSSGWELELQEMDEEGWGDW